MAALPLRIRLRMYWHNIRLWWLNLTHPLSDEQKAANMEDLIDPPDDEQAEAPE